MVGGVKHLGSPALSISLIRSHSCLAFLVRSLYFVRLDWYPCSFSMVLLYTKAYKNASDIVHEGVQFDLYNMYIYVYILVVYNRTEEGIP